MSANRDAALAYAKRGWQVVPTWHLTDDGHCSCPRGAECGAAGKHPRVRDWVNAATTDEQIIRQWWGVWPQAHVSIVTGEASGLFVIDIDVKSGGFESVEDYEVHSQFGLPTTLTAVTGSGGRHLFYQWPGGVDVPSRTNWLQGVDVRGRGGQVVAPPSSHKSGGFYTWSAGWESGPVEPPVELVKALIGPSQGPAKPDIGAASEILAGIAEGARNETLFRWACRLRRQLDDDRAAVEVLVLEAGRRAVPPMPDSEMRDILDSAFKQDHDDGGPTWTGGGVSDEDDPDFTGIRPLTDDGNALRLTDRHGKNLVWTDSRGWLNWDGQRWRRDRTLKVQGLARETVRSIYREEVERGEDREAQERITRWAHSSQASSKIDAMIRLARDNLSAEEESFDADPWLMTVKNGTLDLRSGQLMPHDRAHHITRTVGVRYEEGADCPHWREFVEMVLPDAEVREYVQKAVGYSLTGSTSERCLFILWGAGKNGKSTLIENVRDLLMGDYAMTAAKSLIMQGSQEHPTELAGLVGRRFVTLGEEVDKRDRLRTSLLKSLTGGDTVTARFMRQDYFEFVPQAKLWIATNHKPGLTDFGEAMTARIRLVPFTVRISDETDMLPRDMVDEIFKAEGAGILNWALEGLIKWRDTGLGSPASMEEELTAWVDEEDQYGQFIAECLEAVNEEGAWSSTHDVYERYCLWMAQRGEVKFTVGLRTLSKELKSRNVHVASRDRKSGWVANVPSLNTYGV